MNLPNKLSTIRILAVPFVILLMIPIFANSPVMAGWNTFVEGPIAAWAALILFVLAALTDFIDGRIARGRHLITDLGKFLDTVADKLLILSVLAVYVQKGRIHSFLFAIIMARELMVTALRSIAAAKGLVLAAKPVGKWKMGFQCFAIVFLMLEDIMIASARGGNAAMPGWMRAPADVCLAVSVVLSIFSAYDYIWNNRQVFQDK